jgi:hypothetical protein
VRFEAMLCTGDLNSRAMVLACEADRTGEQLLTNTLATMLRRDDETSNSANR